VAEPKLFVLSRGRVGTANPSPAKPTHISLGTFCLLGEGQVHTIDLKEKD
jgi:hypothetical protein